MPATLVNQIQINNSRSYDDTIAPSLANFETNATTLADDVDSLVSAINNLKGSGNWYDDFDGSAVNLRDVSTLGTDLDAVETKTFLFRNQILGDVTVPATQNWVVLGVGEIPSASPFNISATVATTSGAVGVEATAFDANSLDEVAGANALNPKNLVVIRDAVTFDAIESGGREVYALWQVEDGTDGYTIATATAGSDTRAQLSFVRSNAAGDDLEACPVADIEGLTINYAHVIRLEYNQIPEEAFLTGLFVDQAAASDVTLTNAIANQTGEAPQNQNIDVAVADTFSWDFLAGSGGDSIINMANAGGVATLTLGSAGTATTTVAGTTLDINVTDDVTIASGLVVEDGGNQDLRMGGAAGAGTIDTATGSLTLNGASGATLSTTAGGTTVTSAATTVIDSTTMTDIQSAAGAINIGTDAVASTITMGNATGATSVDFDSGTGAFSFDSTTADTAALMDLTTTGTGGDSVGLFVGNSSPDGRVTAPIGSLFVDGTNGALWQNTDGVTDWAQFDAAGATNLSAAINAQAGTPFTAGAFDTQWGLTDGQFLEIGDSTNTGILTVAAAAAGDSVTVDLAETAGGATFDVTDGTNSLFTMSATTTGDSATFANLETFSADTAGAISLDAAGASNFTVDGANLTLSTTTSGNLVASSAGDVDVDGANITMDATSGVSIDAAAASNFTVDGADLVLSTTTSGELDMTSAGLMDMNAGANLDIDVTGTFDMLSTGAFSIDGTGASNVTADSGNLTVSATTTGSVLVDGVDGVEINSTGGALNIGNDADAQAINIGTGAAARTITVGNATGATAVNLDAGTGAFSLDSTVGGSAALMTLTTTGADGDSVEVFVSDLDPSAGAGIAAPVGSTLHRDQGGAGTTGEMWLKTGALDTDWEQFLTGTAGLTDLQTAYEAGNTIATDATNMAFDVSGTEAISLDAGAASNFTVDGADLALGTTTSGELDLTSAGLMDMNAGANLDIDVTGTFDMLSSGAFSIDGTGASNVSAASGNLTIETTTSGTLALQGVDSVDIDATGDSADVTVDAGNSLSTTGGSVTVNAGSGGLTNAGGSIDLTAGDAGTDAIGGGVSLTGGAGGTTSGAGGPVSLLGGNATDGDGGAIDITGGTAGATNDGGDITLTAGTGGATSGDGGRVDVFGGDAPTDGVGGVAALTGGASAGNNAGGAAGVTGGAGSGTGNGGSVTLFGGAAGTTGNGGPISLTATNGGATSGDGGAVVINSGNGGGDGAGGAITITSGDGAGTDQDGGDITIDAGSATGTGDGGAVSIFSGPSSVGDGDAGDIFLTAANGFDSAGNVIITAGNSSGGGHGRTTIQLSTGGAPGGTPTDADEVLRLLNAGTNGGTSDVYLTDQDPVGNILANPGSLAIRENGTSSALYIHIGAASNNTDWEQLATGAATLEGAWASNTGVTTTLQNSFTGQVSDTETYLVQTETGNHSLLSLAAVSGADVVTIGHANEASVVDIDSGTGGTDIDSAGAVTIDAAAASNFTVAGAALTLETTGAANTIVQSENNAVLGSQEDAGTPSTGVLLITNGVVDTTGTGFGSLGAGTDSAIISLLSGQTSGAGNSGEVSMNSGTATGSGTSGNIGIGSGQNTGTGNSGNLNMGTGLTSAGTSGNVLLSTGGGTTSGDISIFTSDADTAGDITITGGDSSGSTVGGGIQLNTGDGGTNAEGGAVVINQGNGNGTAEGGNAVWNTGDGGATANGGSFTVNTGDGGATSGDGGNVSFNLGSAAAGGSAGGDFAVTGGAGNGAGAGGTVALDGGTGGATGAGGSLTLTGGAGGATSGDGGSVTFVPGATNSGTDGVVGVDSALGLSAPVLRLDRADGTSGVTIDMFNGSVDPETNVTANQGDLYFRDGGANGNEVVYVKGTGDATNTGWVALTSATSSGTRLFFQDTLANNVTAGNPIQAGDLDGGVLPTKPAGLTFDTEAEIYINGILQFNGTGNDVEDGTGNEIDLVNAAVFAGDVLTIIYYTNL